MNNNNKLAYDPNVFNVLRRVCRTSVNDARICLAIIGASESGKTTLVLNIIQMIRHRYDMILLFSQTENAQQVFARTGVINMGGGRLTDDFLNKIKASDKSNLPRMLVLMDDLPEAIYAGSVYNQLIRHMRHFNIHAITITHTLKHLPPTMRSEMDIFWVFKSNAPPNILDMRPYFKHLPIRLDEVFVPNWQDLLDASARSHAIFFPKNIMEYEVVLFPTALPCFMTFTDPVLRNMLDLEFTEEFDDDQPIGGDGGGSFASARNKKSRRNATKRTALVAAGEMNNADEAPMEEKRGKLLD